MLVMNEADMSFNQFEGAQFHFNTTLWQVSDHISRITKSCSTSLAHICLQILLICFPKRNYIQIVIKYVTS